ncbi:hypothetical protein PQU92_08245 [Asticcacaulis sp. BYS171W]|uniref:Chitinase n=1 Tax=Asticcacaulis aquaticus TaxID=2984212 RepID=A0ABT5HT98_9CAUL|nr:hypothetical protein [Asticcacaulis aquaticus]MDC7683264.1 hypothetical protein [Asticcacaulis aquaticus]
MTLAIIMALQTALLALKFDIGKIDGDLGPKTLAGLLAYLAGRAIDVQIRTYADALAPEMKARGINTPLRIAHFLATIIHETAGLTRFEENLAYSKPERLDALFSNVKGLAHAASLIKAGVIAIGNCIYAGRGGNGDESSGDGYRFRGRGPFQLTLRDNYRMMAAKLNVPLEVDPDLALRPEISARIAGQYWADKSLNKFADLGASDTIRARVNGTAMAGLSDCQRLADKVLKLFN